MPKLNMEPVRRRQVVKATMDCIHADGIEKTTLQRIARRAGITAGLISYYFGDKDGLIEAVYRDLYKRVSVETLHRLRHAATPKERLMAVLEAQVHDTVVEPRVVATWFTLGGIAPDQPRLARLERINARRLTSNIVHTLKRVGLRQAEALEIAQELLVMIYGIWTNLGHRSIASSDQARAILHRYLKARVPQIEK